MPEFPQLSQSSPGGPESEGSQPDGPTGYPLSIRSRPSLLASTEAESTGPKPSIALGESSEGTDQVMSDNITTVIPDSSMWSNRPAMKPAQATSATVTLSDEAKELQGQLHDIAHDPTIRRKFHSRGMARWLNEGPESIERICWAADLAHHLYCNLSDTRQAIEKESEEKESENAQGLRNTFIKWSREGCLRDQLKSALAARDTNAEWDFYDFEKVINRLDWSAGLAGDYEPESLPKCDFYVQAASILRELRTVNEAHSKLREAKQNDRFMEVWGSVENW
ncbi:hypothetical protein CI109_100931 [Kwoniella shandongensis]|uniref:Uncharacterized protein n=1 Tax=Kwoniella shandongensis TaxID=1734106 RepID=A0A5M6C9B4_9TREE|nr:uncharacterized protein CI109_001397 [Kwoniella shandongensis]KAA5529995.1 hypothetical protein CI109_001397 [Kwoniella shandongensis]